MERQTPESITQHTSIGDADALLRMGPVIVREDASLEEVAQRAVENAGCRVVAVTDEDDRLVGVLPVRVLVNDIFLKIVPEEFLGEIEDYEAVLQYAGHIGARTARDVMRPPVGVSVADTVRDAFGIMHEAKLNGLPITDADNRVVGYIDQLELLLVWVRASGREQLLRPLPDQEG